MAFQDSFHEIVPGYRINGRSVVFVIKGVSSGGVGGFGRKTLELGNFGVGHRNFIETDDPDNWPDPSAYFPVTDIDALYQSLELAGLSTIVEGTVLVNPSNVSLLEYNDDSLVAESLGAGTRFVFQRSNGEEWVKQGDRFLVPNSQFDNFKELALARLSTLLEIAGETASHYIALDGSNDYVEFTDKGADNVGLLDWTKDWSLGINLVDFEVKADQKFITLFSSGSNAIMLRRGGSNHGLYITGNNGATKIGANTWYAPNPGGKLLFVFYKDFSRLRYYIGNVDGTYALRASYFVNTTNIGGNTPGSELCVGKRVSNNAVAESLYYHGGLNNLIVAAEPLEGPLVEEYFQVNNTYDESTFYADLTSWAQFGEDAFPTVTDTKGVMSGGTLVNGQEGDFVELPTDA